MTRPYLVIGPWFHHQERLDGSANASFVELPVVRAAGVSTESGGSQ